LTVTLFLVPVALGQAVINKSRERDVMATAFAGLSDGGHLQLVVDANLKGETFDNGAINAFVFVPSASAFTFHTEALAEGEFSFAKDLSTANVTKTMAGDGGFAGTSFNITWTAISGLLKTHTAQHITNEEDNSVFQFNQQARSRFATVSGTADGATCCTFIFNTATIAKSSRHSIQVIRP